MLWYYANQQEQLLIETRTSKRVVNGPCRVLPSLSQRVTVRPATLLGKLDWVKVRDDLTGEVRVEKGPQLLFRGAYDVIVEQGKAESLGKDSTTYLLVQDSLSGDQRTVKGPAVFVPGPYDVILERRKAITLKCNEYLVVKDTTTGAVWVEKGQQVLFLEPTHELLFTTPRKAVSLKANQFLYVLDRVSGQVRMEKGEQMFFYGSMEEVVEERGNQVREAINLKVFEFVRVLNTATGAVTVHRGEQLVFLTPYERLLSNGVEKAVEVDEETAVLVRNKRSGQQRLVTDKGLFFPEADEEVLEVRQLERLADFEVMILKDQNGVFSFYHGSKGSGKDVEVKRAFFVPPHSSVVQLLWSRGRRREKRDMRIEKIDCRPQYMSFEFNCRTSDNVELVLEGTFFWQVVDVPAMLKFTGDTTGDICNHARSRFIQLISKVTLQEFMATFNDIALQAHAGDDEFYGSRGVKIHSLEVTGYRCADASTAKILEQIVQETTNRLNRLSQQESENEVKMHRLKGDIDQEKLSGELLQIQNDHQKEEGRIAGLAEAEKVSAFLQGLGSELDMDTKVEMWKVLRKTDALRAVSQGNAQVYFTPADCNLSIEHGSRVRA